MSFGAEIPKLALMKKLYDIYNITWKNNSRKQETWKKG